MPLSVGDKVGHYEVISLLGKGGMGEVWKARDTTLRREVALKVLPATFLGDPDRMARFQREAEVLAALDHPNIGHIYGIVESADSRALVLALIEGPTLADRIAAGPLPQEEAIAIAKQIIEALEYAHDRGVVHRDLKPTNVKITPEGVVKVLDFGLAKVLEDDPPASSLTNSPTLTLGHTRAGMILGTAAYMSPEQAVGRPVDRRSDIFSFGTVLFEMLTGRHAFTGAATPDVLEAVVKSDPDWSALPAGTPAYVRRLLERCLVKDRKQRLQAIGEARIALSGPMEDPAAQAPTPPRHRSWLPWSIAAFFLLALMPVNIIHLREKPPAVPVQRFEIAPPGGFTLPYSVLSPDGSRLVFGGFGASNTALLWVRRLDSLEARPLPGTEGADGTPFWSPDSRQIAFTAGGKLKKIDAAGGPAETICDAGVGIGGLFTLDGKKIVFNGAGDLYEVPAGGGTASPLPGVEHSGPKGGFEGNHVPALLPDGRHFIFTRQVFRAGAPAPRPVVYLGDLDAKPGAAKPPDTKQSPPNLKRLLTVDSQQIAFAPSSDDPNLGYVLFLRSDPPAASLMAQPLDLRKLDIIGDPILIADRASDFTVSRTGILVYQAAAFVSTQLTLFNRQGQAIGTVGEPGSFESIAFSPDGTRVIATRLTQSGENLWMIDLARNLSTQFTFGSGSAAFPAWSPDGKRIAFSWDRGGNGELYQKLSNGGGDEELMFKSQNDKVALSWSGDGHYLMFGDGFARDANASVLPVDGNGHATGKPFPFLRPGAGLDERFSPGPQGKPVWVAYESNESGRFEVYVRLFDPSSPEGTPPGGAKIQVSTGGGLSPRWNANGKELFYVTDDRTVMSVDVPGNPAAPFGVPKRLFKPERAFDVRRDLADWDASSDGTRFLFPVAQSGQELLRPFTVVLNWHELLKK